MLLKINHFFKKIKSFVNPYFQKIGNFFVFLANKIKILFRVLKKWEKIIILCLVIIALICAGILEYRNYIKNTKVIPALGGTYIEGLVANNKSEVDQIVQKLTKIGLTYFDLDGNLKPALAESWDISPEGKVYTFHLRSVNSKNIADIIKSHQDLWRDIQIETPDEKSIKFILKEPYSPFLSSTAEPFFEYGPYVLKSQDKSELIFESRNDFVLGEPYLKEIIIKVFPNDDNLDKAVNQGKVFGLAETEDNFKDLTNYSMALPRYLIAFFNLNREQFQNKETRVKIKNNENLGQEIKATLVTTDKDTNIAKAEELKNKWDAIGLKIEVRIVDPVTLQKEIIPARDYDILLYGIDYGYDPDPYPFWHTSQMSTAGLNLSNFSNQKADAFLEEGRQTNDAEARKGKYQEFQKILDDETPAIFLEQMIWKYSVTAKISGTKDHSGVIPADRFNEVWKWYIKEKRVKK